MKNTFLITLCILLLGLVSSCKSDTSSQKSSYTGERISKDIGNDEAMKLIQSQADLVLVDVRTPEEIAGGKINDALEIDFTAADFETKMQALDKDAPYLVYCKGGGRSTQTKNYMETLGFKRIYNLKNGYDGWPK